MFNIKRYSYVGVVLALFIIFGTVNLIAQTAMVTNNFVWYFPHSNTLFPPDNYQCSLAEIKNKFGDDFMPSSGDTGDRSFVTTNTWNYNVSSNDPWHNSALIEFDNVTPYLYSISVDEHPYYPNHCLTLCAEVTCSNPVRLIESTNSSGTATVTNTVKSGDFPIQTILFDIFKYQAGSNPYNADTTPPVRTIAMYPAQGSGVDNICNGVPTCCDAPKDGPFNNQNPSCQDAPQYEISCCEACHWLEGEGACRPKQLVCEGRDYQTQSACQDVDDYCNWNEYCSDKFDTTCKGYTDSNSCDDDTKCSWNVSCSTKPYNDCDEYLNIGSCTHAA